MKLLVGTLYTIENEFQDCLASLDRQTFRDFDHFVIQGVPNRQAHDQLYERFMNNAGEYDFFIKLDADMVIRSQHLFANIVTEFEQRPQIDLLTILVHDYFTDRQVEELEAHPDVILCHHDVEQLTETKKNPLRKDRFTLARNERQYLLAEEPYFLVRNYICNPTVMVRSSTLLTLPFYSRQLFQFEDWLMWTLLAEHGPFLFLPDKLTHYRYHAAAATADVTSNPLVWYYSRVELLLCAISRLNRKSLQNQAYIQLQATLMNLFMEYMKDDGELSEDILVDTATFGKKMFTSSPQDLENAAIASLNPKNLAKHMPINQLGLALIMKAIYRLQETE